MKTLTILEGNINLAGVVVVIVGAIILAALVLSLIVTVITKLIYERKGDRKFTKNNLSRPCLYPF